jgi:DNA-binding IclR family transcriptional regulator
MARLKSAADAAEIDRVEASLAAVRRDGVATVIGTVLAQTAAVSAGVRLYSGECVAFSISCPTERIDKPRAAEFAVLVRHAIDEIAHQLGGAA